MPNPVAANRGRASMGAKGGIQTIVHRRLEHGPTMKEPKRVFMNGATLVLEDEVKQRWPRGGPGTSHSFRSIRREVHRGGNSGRVFTTAGYGRWVEEGRKPGRYPPMRRITPWARRAGIPAFLVARSIALKGTEGKFAMRDGARAAEPRIQRLLGGRVRSEVKAWRSRARRG